MPLPDHLSSSPVGTEQVSPELLREHQRERVFRAATAVFAKRGYAGTTVDNIVAAAKVGVGNFYSLFDGKEECFLGVLDRSYRIAGEAIIAAQPADGSWPVQVISAVDALVDLASAEPDTVHVGLRDVAGGGDRALELYDEKRDQATALLRAGREIEERDRPELLEMGLVSGAVAVLAKHVDGEGARDPELLAAELSRFLLKAYLGPSEIERLLESD